MALMIEKPIVKLAKDVMDLVVSSDCTARQANNALAYCMRCIDDYSQNIPVSKDSFSRVFAFLSEAFEAVQQE
mgnify:FL=1